MLLIGTQQTGLNWFTFATPTAEWRFIIHIDRFSFIVKWGRFGVLCVLVSRATYEPSPPGLCCNLLKLKPSPYQ
jgi:hypothetical protein